MTKSLRHLQVVCLLLTLFGLTVESESHPYIEITGRRLSSRDITRLSSVKVPPEYVQQIVDLGYSDISVSDIVRFWSVKVDPEYIKKIKDLGYRRISDNDIVKFWSVKVDPEYIKKIKDLGYRTISDNDIVRFWSVKVDPDYIKKIKDLGYRTISDNDIVKYWSSQVDPEYIKKMKGVIVIKTPEIKVAVIKPDDIKPVIASGASLLNKFGGWTMQLAFGICLIIAASGIAAYLNSSCPKKQEVSIWPNRIDDRLTTFERRVTDVQDILISIDDRLNQRVGIG